MRRRETLTNPGLHLCPASRDLSDLALRSVLHRCPAVRRLPLRPCCFVAASSVPASTDREPVPPPRAPLPATGCHIQLTDRGIAATAPQYYLAPLTRPAVAAVAIASCPLRTATANASSLPALPLEQLRFFFVPCSLCLCSARHCPTIYPFAYCPPLAACPPRTRPGTGTCWHWRLICWPGT